MVLDEIESQTPAPSAAGFPSAQNVLQLFPHAEPMAVVNQSQFSEFGHKVANARTRCADHLGHQIDTAVDWRWAQQ